MRDGTALCRNEEAVTKGLTHTVGDRTRRWRVEIVGEEVAAVFHTYIYVDIAAGIRSGVLPCVGAGSPRYHSVRDRRMSSVHPDWRQSTTLSDKVGRDKE